MRRFVVLTLAVLLASGYFPGPAAAVDNRGPACTDIIPSASGTYQVRPEGPSGNAVFHFEFATAAGPCDFVTYYLYIDSSAGRRTATYPETAGNDHLTLCGSRFCYDHDFGSTTVSPLPPTLLIVTGETKILSHSADMAGPLDFVLCDTNSGDPTYPNCPSGENSWDQ